MTNIDVLIVTTDGNATIESMTGDWKSIKEKVGGWLEAVGGELGKWTAYGDEEGRLKGLPVNHLATGLLQAMGSVPVIVVGTVVFVGQTYVGGEDGYIESSIPNELRELAFPLG